MFGRSAAMVAVADAAKSTENRAENLFMAEIDLSLKVQNIGTRVIGWLPIFCPGRKAATVNSMKGKNAP